MKKPEEKREILRHAMLLVTSKGDDAVDHANKMVKRMQKTGDKEGQAFWERIATQIELLVHEPPPD